ncbi:MAG: prephenate dehydrogenase [Christensenellales bacterium]
MGLGLIGGSLAKAYKKQGGHEVLACDIDPATEDIALLANACDGRLRPENVGGCDLLLLALYPEAACDYLRGVAPLLAKSALVIDCCGTKRAVCEVGFALARAQGFTFAGGHPMAGTHHSGFGASRAELFSGATMVIVPAEYDDIRLLARIQDALKPAGFKNISVTSAEEHDRVIAFTSQLAHVVSSAFIKSPTARGHKGVSAGSYKDLTRVAWLNPDMWTPLFIENRENLVRELDGLMAQLAEYRNAIQAGDAPALRALLAEGALLKEEIDGRG